MSYQTERDMVYYLEAVQRVDQAIKKIAAEFTDDDIRRVTIQALKTHRNQIRAEYESRHSTRIAEA